MRPLLRWLGAAACLAVLGLTGCGSGQPRPGDTVSPKLDQPLRWMAGRNAQISIRLQAQGKDEGQPRPLNFISGVSEDPVARVTFFAGSEKLGDERTVTLSHRC